jgi:putative ABC transport system permease protein
MNLLEYALLALTALAANKVRAVLTMLGIIIGVASVILLVAIGSGLQAFITDQFKSLGSNTVYIMPGKMDLKNAKGPMLSVSKFELTDVSDLIRGSTAIRTVAPMTASTGTITFEGESVSTEVVGTWESYFSIQNFTATSGDIIRQSDVERVRKVVTLGATPAKDLFGDRDPVGEYITLNNIRYQVKGVLDAKGGSGAMGASVDDHAFIPLTTALRQFNQTKPLAIMIGAANQDDVARAAEDAKQILGRRLKPDDFTVMQQNDLLNTITQLLGAVTIALGGIAAISLLVGGIGIMNIMLVSVTERTHEIGLRKAVGGRPQDILFQFLIESVVLSVVGGSIGIALGELGALALSSFIHTSVTLWSVLLAFGFSATIGIIFGVAPAIRAARLDPIVALRYE